MSTLWWETIFVSSVGYGICNTIRSYIFELPLDSDGFLFTSSVFQLALFLGGNSVASLVSAIKKCIVSSWPVVLFFFIRTRSWIHQCRCYPSYSWRLQHPYQSLGEQLMLRLQWRRVRIPIIVKRVLKSSIA